MALHAAECCVDCFTCSAWSLLSSSTGIVMNVTTFTARAVSTHHCITVVHRRHKDTGICAAGHSQALYTMSVSAAYVVIKGTRSVRAVLLRPSVKKASLVLMSSSRRNLCRSFKHSAMAPTRQICILNVTRMQDRQRRSLPLAGLVPRQSSSLQ